ncbi:MAG TPA: hypothetical protein VHF89_06560, partial [Solirubrobacteraceae bacterium]|nr:hypothetical protein [Solirubrobacteraceae bacterium]
MRPTLGLACLLALLAPAAAHGQNRAVETGARGPHLGSAGYPGSVAGPFFAGRELVWAEVDPRRTLAVVAHGPGGRRVIDRRPYEGDEFYLDVDEGEVALAQYVRAEHYRSVLRAGPLTGPLTVVERTCAFSPLVARGALGGGCPATLLHENAIEVHEAAGVRRYLTRSPAEAEMEGDLLGVHQESRAGRSVDLVVLRRSTGEELLRVHGETGQFDLAPDGSVAYTWAYRTRQVRTASPPRPKPRVIDNLPFAPDEVRLRGDRIAVRARETASFNSAEGQFISKFAVLDRRSGRVLASHSVRRTDRDWDFDGERLTWVAKPCMRSYVVTWDVDRPPPAEPAAPCVHARPRGPARVDADGVLSVPLFCPPGGGECGGVVEAVVRVRDEGERPRYVHRWSVPPIIVRSPGTRWTATWRLHGRTLEAVRRARDAEVVATITRFGGTGPTATWGGSEPREHTIPLVRESA